jgi:Mannosyl-glycoprotein endo-beta-N-acetylglucosaminidase
MGVSMMCRVGAQSALAFATAVSVLTFSASAFAADLPQIKLSAKNTVPQCATPGRLMAFLETRNKSLDDKFSTIAADYARIGDELQIRWDVAFFQMLLETGNLTFTGDVSAKQNNFAGLGATGKHEPGESFPDVSTGVKAHLQHLLMYAGEKLDNPVAERTRKVQEWGVLTSWQKTVEGPMTFVQLAKKWAPGSKSYARDIENVQDSFMDGPCKQPDPKPELMAKASPASDTNVAAKSEKTEKAITAEQQVASADASEDGYTPPKVSGAELARKANEEARANGGYVRSNLGAGMLAAMSANDKPTDVSPAAASPSVDAAATPPPAVKILNAPKVDAAASTPPSSAPEAPTKDVATKETSAKFQVAALGAGTKPVAKDAPSAAKSSKCKVWTASYGGTRAVIIKASADSQDNYTVLDVNEGTEQREAEAYISAYAKGGQKVGEFNSPTSALDKAFELCPEG